MTFETTPQQLNENDRWCSISSWLFLGVIGSTSLRRPIRLTHSAREESITHHFLRTPRLYITLWNTWTKSSDQQGPLVDWRHVFSQVRRHPRIARYHDEKPQGMLLLHLVCALKPPLQVVREVLAANPQAVWHKSTTQGLLPLHIAVGRNAHFSVVQLLIQQDPTTLLVPDNNGHNALSWALRDDVSKNLVKLILMFNPSLALRKQSDGESLSPLEFIYRQRHYYKDGHVVPLWQDDQWNKLIFLLWAAHYGTVVSPRNGQTLSTLHAALALSSPTHILDDVVRRYALHSSGIRDTKGNYPLHYAVKTSNASRMVVLKLIECFPPAVSIRDAHGRLPLLEALRHGRSWQEGIKKLYKIYPAAITETDTETSLPPAALAALSTDDLTTIYSLLREYPQVLLSRGSRRNVESRIAS